jgi:hypothetical protein
VAQIKINNTPVPTADIGGNTTLAANTNGIINLNFTWANGNNYKIDLFDSSGQGVGSTQQYAPGA